MNKFLLAGFLFLCCFLHRPIFTNAQQQFTLDEIIERAKSQSPSSKWAETRKENRYWNYRTFRTTFNPQLRLEGDLPVYYKSVNQIIQQDGTFRYIPVQQTNNSVTLGLRQLLPFTGGTVSVNSGLGFFKDYNDETALAEQWSGSVFYVGINQPIFAFNPYRWNKR